LTRLRDELSRLRRKLPWVKIEKTYLFDAPGGRVSLAELFDGRSQLVVYHFMSKQMGIPEQADFCPICSMVGDHINTDFVHPAHRDVTLVAITLAPLARIEPVKVRMGWQFTFVSSHGTDFNRDFGVRKGRDEDALPFPMAWIRHRDRYKTEFADADKPYRPTTPSPSSAGCACGAAEARS
jgi:predicted dithiol-disulfide oxidoreductase (DUF899 family)